MKTKIGLGVLNLLSCLFKKNLELVIACLSEKSLRVKCAVVAEADYLTESCE